MTLVLSITNADHLDNGEPTQIRLDRHGAVIGRSAQSDWSLPDPKSYISSTHCEIDYRDGAYMLVDKSTNGTFINGGSQRLGAPHRLTDGDVISIGHYRVAVSGAGGAPASTANAAAPSPGASGQGWGGWDAGGSSAPTPSSSAWDAPASADSWGAAPAAAPSPTPPSAPAPDPQGWASSSAAPAGSDAWGSAPEPAKGGWASDSAPSQGSASWSPHAPAPAADAWSASPAAATSPSTSAWGEPSGSAGGDWPSRGAEPAASSVWGAAGAGPAAPAASGWDAMAPARGGGAAPAEGGAAPSPVSGRGALSGAWTPPRVEAQAAEPVAADALDVWGAMAASNTVDWARGGFGASPAPAAPGPSGGDAAWEALLAAAGVGSDGVKASPVQAATTAGALLKRMVAGLVVMMEARARAKAQLGAQSTTLELNGNNPLKFARSPERVLQQLLNPPERGFMGAADAVEDSFRDLQAHQMATLAAMQGALRATLDRFSPEAIRKRAEMRGVLSRILPAARNATLWEAYEREFEGVAKGSDEAFMDVFAKAFKEAYERTAAQMKSQARGG